MDSRASVAIAVPCALGAAACFAVANVEQMRAARRADAPSEISHILMVRLMRDRQWLIGFATSVGGYGLQAVGLFIAPVALVQPLIVTELLFALPLAAHYGGRRLGPREWAGVLVVAGGISAFLVVGSPTGNGSDLSNTAFVLITAIAGGVVALLVLLSESVADRPMLRASGLALAASACFGMLSVFTKVVGHQFEHDKAATLLHVQIYVLAVFAIAGLVTSQTAFRIAPLSVSLPLIDVGEPFVASFLAVVALHEKLDLSSGTAVGVAFSGAAVALGVGILDTSPLVQAAQVEVSQSLQRSRDEPEPDPAPLVDGSGA
jgi:drug/metabolite transporter (DMT)-like permease